MLIIICPMLTHRIDSTGSRSVPTGTAAEVAQFIGEATALGFRVVDARVFAGEEHLAGGFLVNA